MEDKSISRPHWIEAILAECDPETRERWENEKTRLGYSGPSANTILMGALLKRDVRRAGDKGEAEQQAQRAIDMFPFTGEEYGIVLEALAWDVEAAPTLRQAILTVALSSCWGC
jgi:hypothetical protein